MYEAQTGESDEGADRSLLSGHSAGAVAIAHAVSDEFVIAAIAAYGSSALVAPAQVLQKAHYPSDILSGAIIGLSSGFEW